MAKVVSYSKTGAKQEAGVTLNKTVFAAEVNEQLVADAYRTYLANGRTNNAKTLKRGEVRGGGKKPWRQKGTGRARFGSIRVPIWRGGGIAFGPTGHENYALNMPTKAKRSALRQALTIKTNAKAVIVLDEFASNGKTKDAAALFTKVGAQGGVLLVLATKAGEADRATRNIASVKTVAATYLNVFDVMNADTIVIEKAALEVIDKWLGDK